MSADEAPTRVDLARTPAFDLGPLEVRPATREVALGERREVLEPRVMQVLTALARRRGEVVSRDELIETCWAGRVVGEDAINRAIAGVRRVSEAFGCFTVETVARVGYRLSVREARDNPRARRPLVWGVGVGALALVLLVAAGVAFWPRQRSAGPVAPIATRIAVLPFEASGPGNDARALADSLLDTLIDSMATGRVQPMSRTESLALRGPGARREMDRLGVDLLLDGAVRSDGKMLKVSVHLSDARNQTTLWSRDFDGPIERADHLQIDVAESVTDRAASLLYPQVQRFRSKPSALAAFLDADNLYEPGSITLLRQAIAIAPDFSVAYGSLADALILNAPPAPSAARDEAYAEAEQDVRREIGTDPTNGEGYFIQAWAFTPPLAWAEQERLFRKAVEMMPIEPDTHIGYGGFLRSAGRIEEALPHEKQAVALRPYFQLAREQLMATLIIAGHVDEAADVVADAQRLWPDSAPWKGADFFIALNKAQWSRALRLLDEPGARQLIEGPEKVDAWRTIVSALNSNDAARKAAAAQAVKSALVRGVFEGDKGEAIAAISALGDVDGALAEATRLIGPRRMLVVGGAYQTVQDAGFDTSFLFQPMAAAMHRDRRFMALAAKLGLVDYWRTSGHWPDFCSDTSLPYDCKIEAAKLTARPPS